MFYKKKVSYQKESFEIIKQRLFSLEIEAKTGFTEGKRIESKSFEQ